MIVAVVLKVSLDILTLRGTPDGGPCLLGVQVEAAIEARLMALEGKNGPLRVRY